MNENREIERSALSKKHRHSGLTLPPADNFLRQSQHGVGRRLVHHPEKLGRFRAALGHLHKEEVRGQLRRDKQSTFCILVPVAGAIYTGKKIAGWVRDGAFRLGRPGRKRAVLCSARLRSTAEFGLVSFASFLRHLLSGTQSFSLKVYPKHARD